MPLPAKRKKSDIKPVEKGKGLSRTKLNRPIAGLTGDQMGGSGDMPDEVKATPKPKSKKGKAKSGGTGLY